MNHLIQLVNELCQLPDETQWLEFKHDNYTPAMIGQDISALANSAALHDKDCAYMIWGIDDATHDIVGTSYNLQSLKKGSQELENWLRSLLSNNAEFEFHSLTIEEKTVGVLIIHKAIVHPVRFEKVDYVRIGSYTKKLSDYPAVQAQLWDKLRTFCYEDHDAAQHLTLSQALQLLDYPRYFELRELPLPTTQESIGHYLCEENLLKKQDNGLYTITNLGALLFARQLSAFDRVARKALRIVQYQDNSRLNILRETTIDKGYVSGFADALTLIEALLPAAEPIHSAVREKHTAYPMPVVREAIANALIHQDFSITGTGPVVELFAGRIEITNAGTPLIDTFRIIDNPPKSRNEKLAALMRRLRMCEELGSGWDRMVIHCKLAQLPAPKIDTYSDSTRITLYAKKAFADLSTEDKLWACYLHACVKYVQGDYLTNRSLRERFGLGTSSSAPISRLIKEAVAQNILKPFDPNTAPRYMKYMPIWA